MSRSFLSFDYFSTSRLGYRRKVIGGTILPSCPSNRGKLSSSLGAFWRDSTPRAWPVRDGGLYRRAKASNSGGAIDLLASLNDSNLSRTVTSTAYFHVERRERRYEGSIESRIISRMISQRDTLSRYTRRRFLKLSRGTMDREIVGSPLNNSSATKGSYPRCFILVKSRLAALPLYVRAVEGSSDKRSSSVRSIRRGSVIFVSTLNPVRTPTLQ